MDEKLEILIDQIGRLTEGLTDQRLVEQQRYAEQQQLVEQQRLTGQEQMAEQRRLEQQRHAEIMQNFANLERVVQQQAEIARQQAESISRLITLLEQR